MVGGCSQRLLLEASSSEWQCGRRQSLVEGPQVNERATFKREKGGLEGWLLERTPPAHMAAHTQLSLFQFQRLQSPLQAAGTQTEHTCIGVRAGEMRQLSYSVLSAYTEAHNCV